MVDRLPCWIGWPRTGNAPGHAWLPSVGMRFAIGFVVCSFLALALTVDWAYSTTFFLLALFGIYIGLRRGFLNGLTKAEKLLLLVFCAYPLFAIVSYAAGVQTNLGFRILGRELRFALFVPIYLALRWSNPPRRLTSLAAVGGVLAAVAVAAHGWMHGSTAILSAGGDAPAGVTGTHITFGDMGLMFGVIAAALLWPCRNKTDWLIAMLGLGAGIAVALLSLARGSWVAIPILVGVWVFGSVGYSWKGLAIGAVVLGLFLAVGVSVRHGGTLSDRWHRTYKTLMRSIAETNASYSWKRCPNDKIFLEQYAESMFPPIGGPPGDPIVRHASSLPAPFRAACDGGYLIRINGLHHGSGWLTLNLPRMGFPSQQQSFSALVRGDGRLLLWDPRSVIAFSTRKFQPVTVSSRRLSPGVPASLLIPPGGRIELIPLQKPYTYGGYNLVLHQGSITDRLHMWRFAWKLFAIHPVAGNGLGSFRQTAEVFSLRRNADAVIGRAFEHPHSSYLNALYSGGIILFVSLLALIFFPLLVTRSLSAYLLALPMAVFALTESIFVHSFVISAYTVLVALWAATTGHQETKSTG